MLKNIAIGVAVILSLPALIIGSIGAWNASHVISKRIQDGTIQESDFEEILDASLKFPDGQILDTQILFNDEEGVNPEVLGLSLGGGLWRVFVGEDALFVDPPTGGVDSDAILNGSITNEDLAENVVSTTNIVNSTIQLIDLGFPVVSSLDGVFNNGGNIDLVAGNNIAISPNNTTNSIGIAVVDGPGSGLDADTLDGLDSTHFVEVTGDTMTGNLVMQGANIDAQGNIHNSIGDLLLNDNTHITGNTDIDGNLNIDGTLTVMGESFHYSPEHYFDIIDAQGGITNTTSGILDLNDSDGINITSTLGDINITTILGSNRLSTVIGDNTVATIIGNNAIDTIIGDNTMSTIIGNNIFRTTLGDNIFFGDVLPGTDSTYNLGALGMEWATIYVDNIFGCMASPGGSSYCDDAHVVGNTDLDGLLNVDGATTLNADVSLGDTNADTIYANGYFGTGLTPVVTDSFDLGTAALRWRDGYFNNSVRVGTTGDQTRVEEDAIRKAGGDLTISTFNGGGNLVLDPQTMLIYSDAHILPSIDNTYNLGSALNRWANIYVANVNGCVTSPGGSTYCDNANVVGNTDLDGTLNVDNDSTLNGNVILGDNPSDSLAFIGSVNSNFIPMFNDTYDLGSGAFRFQNGFFSDSVRVGAPGLQTRVEPGLVNAVGSGLTLTSGAGNINLDPSTLITSSDGSINPTLDLTYDLGTALLRWDELFVEDINANGLSVDTLTVNTLLTSNGNSIFGNAVTDLISFGGTVNTSVLPNTSATNDLGSAALRWDELFAVDGNFSDDVIVTDDVLIQDSLRVDGQLDARGNIFNATGSVVVNDDFAINGNTTIGNASSDSITVNGRFASNLIADLTATRDLGSNAIRWNNIYGTTLHISAINPTTDTNFGGGYGSTGTTIYSNGDVAINGKLTVDGTIDPTDIILTPAEGQVAIDVKSNAGGGTSNFTVDENGNVVANGDLTVGGQLNVDNLSVNAQLTVNDLVVNNSADISGDIISNLIPDVTNIRALGSSVYRWSDVYGTNGNFSGTLIVGSTNVQGALNALDDRLDTAETNITNLQTSVSNLQTAATSLDSRIDAYDTLNIGPRLTALEAAPSGSATGGIASCTLGSTCTINVGAPIASITFTPIGTGNIRIILNSSPVGSNSASITTEGTGSPTLTGVSWVAVLQ